MREFSELLPLRGLVVTLRFSEGASLPFFHQAALTAWLRHLAGSPPGYERVMTLDAPESGCVLYRRGDIYRFTLLALAGGEDLLALLLARLRALPESARLRDRAMPFRDNLVFEAAHDLFAPRAVERVAELTPYDEAALWREARTWMGQASCRLRWLSPARLLLERAARTARSGEGRYCRRATELPFELLEARIRDAVNGLLRARGGENSALPPATGEMVHGDLWWVDAHYRDAGKRAQPMGGVLGVLEFDAGAFTPEHWALWVLGQYLGIGQRRVFGWGRYGLEDEHGAGTLRRVETGGALLERVAETENLHAALEVAREFSAGGEEVVEEVLRLQAGLREGWFQALTWPPFLDRVARQAVTQALGPSWTALREAGDRESGRPAAQAGRDGVIAEIATRAEGGDWPGLDNRLRGLFGDSPLVEWLRRWMGEARELEKPATAEHESPPPVETLEEASDPVLFVTGPRANLTTEGQRLRLTRREDDEEQVFETPWRHLRAVVLFGGHHITTPALKAAFRYEVAVHFATSGGRYLGQASRGTPAKGEFLDLWLAQRARFGDQAAALSAAHSVVTARLYHQREVLRLRNADGTLDKSLVALGDLARSASEAASRASLNGIEGQGGRVYFSALRTLVPAEFGFEGRNRRPPRDPFNALLSLGYTVLYAHVDTVCRVCGLSPWLGFYTAMRFNLNFSHTPYCG